MDFVPATPPRRGARRFDSPQQEAFLNLWRTYDRLRLLEDELFASHGLSAQQYNALRLLRAARPDGMPTLVLARRLISRAPDITRLLDKLERCQFVVRHRPSENRRTVSVQITPAGLGKLDELAEGVQKMHQRQFSHLSDHQLRDFVEFLKLVRKPHEDASCDWLDE